MKLSIYCGEQIGISVARNYLMLNDVILVIFLLSKWSNNTAKFAESGEWILSFFEKKN